MPGASTRAPAGGSKHRPRGAETPVPHQYARIECERRFLLSHLPANIEVTRIRRLRDRYIDGTTLRLREQSEEGSPTIFKLTQKIPAPAAGVQQGSITTIYLTRGEFRLLAELPATTLSKTRYSVPPFGIDVFEGPLEGLVLAEAEFDSATAAAGLTVPSFLSREVTSDQRFTGGQLARAERHDLRNWLSEYGIILIP